MKRALKRRTKIMKKKLLSVLLAGVMVISLAACGGGSGDGGSGDSDNGSGRGQFRYQCLKQYL